MDAHYVFQVRQQHQPSTFHGPARRFGSGGMGAFAIRMGRVAMRLMEKYVLPVAKEFDRNLVSSFVPELANIVSGKKRTRKAVRDVLKNSATKTIGKATGTRRVAEAGAGAVVAGNGGAAGGRAQRCRRPAGRAPPARKRSTIVKTSPVLAVVPHHHHPSATKEVVANPVTHSALDFFERPSVLVNYEGSFDQEVFPHVGCRGPQLDFFVTAENKNCIDLNCICLSLEICLYQLDGTEVKPANVELTLGNNTLHSLSSHVEMFLTGKLISSSNNNYHHLAFVETELTTDIASKRTWAPCQGYRYRANDKANAEAKEKELNDFRKGEKFNLELYGAPHVDFLDCERLLLPGVTLHVGFYRSPNNCALEMVGTWEAADIKRVDQTPYAVVIERASLFVNKIVLSDAVKVIIERALTKSPAV